jgi:hypothetical protein
MSLLRLLIKEGPQAGSVLHKDGPALQVGRTKASQLMIKDPSISEKHAVFAWRNGRWELRDLGSSNGTTLNGVALEREGGGGGAEGRGAAAVPVLALACLFGASSPHSNYCPSSASVAQENSCPSAMGIH